MVSASFGNAMPRGRPITFKCAKCKHGVEYTESGDDWFAPYGKPEPTGEVRDRDGITYAQYRCAECGHVGWTRHASMLRRVGEASKTIGKEQEA
jgi:DNA-directed RNA polymerase subunit RPC12/RpoP